MSFDVARRVLEFFLNFFKTPPVLKGPTYSYPEFPRPARINRRAKLRSFARKNRDLLRRRLQNAKFKNPLFSRYRPLGGQCGLAVGGSFSSARVICPAPAVERD